MVAAGSKRGRYAVAGRQTVMATVRNALQAVAVVKTSKPQRERNQAGRR